MQINFTLEIAFHHRLFVPQYKRFITLFQFLILRHQSREFNQLRYFIIDEYMSQNQVIKKKVQSSQSEENQEKYVEVTPQQFKIIQKKKKELTPSNISNPILSSESKAQTQPKMQAKKLKPVIEDDRKKIQPTYVSKDDNQKQLQNKGIQKNNKNQSKKSFSNQQKDDRHQKYQSKVSINNNKKENTYKQKQKPRNNDDNQRDYRNRNQNKSQYYKSNKINKKYQEKAQYRRQGQRFDDKKRIERENYDVQRIYPRIYDAQNLIHVLPDRTFQDLVKELKKKLNKCQFVAVKAIGSQIIRAFQLVEEMTYHFDHLTRINIPGTVQIQNIYIPRDKRSNLKQYTKFSKKAQITIEVSLEHLDSRHIGYQEYKKTHTQQKPLKYLQKPKPQYRQRQPKVLDKKNSSNRRGGDKQKYQQKQYDERDYR